MWHLCNECPRRFQSRLADRGPARLALSAEISSLSHSAARSRVESRGQSCVGPERLESETESRTPPENDGRNWLPILQQIPRFCCRSEGCSRFQWQVECAQSALALDSGTHTLRNWRLTLSLPVSRCQFNKQLNKTPLSLAASHCSLALQH